MKTIPEVLLIDDETNFHQPVFETFEKEIKSKHYNLTFAETGLRGLKLARQITSKEKSLLIIDLILPDIPGEKLIKILNEEKKPEDNFKAIIISAHKTIAELQKIKETYDWIIDCLPKPIDSMYLKNLVDNLCEQPLQKFNYEELDPETAKFIRQQTGEIKLWMKQTALGAIEAGQKILKIKEKLNYGQFQNWVQSEMECHHNTVLGLMRAAKVFGSDKERIANSGLGLTVVYLLSQGNIPSEMREEVLEISESGTPLSLKEVKNIQKKYTKKKKINKNNQTELSSYSTTTNQLTIPVTTSPQTPKQIPKTSQQQIIKVLPQTIEVQKVKSSELDNKIWQFNQHLLFCGYPSEKNFIDSLPPKVDLILAFPPSSDWAKEALIPVKSNSVAIFQSSLIDHEPIILSDMINNALEAYTESDSNIVISFLPDFDIFHLVDFLDCHCFIADPNLEKCQKTLLTLQKFAKQLN